MVLNITNCGFSHGYFSFEIEGETEEQGPKNVSGYSHSTMYKTFESASDGSDINQYYWLEITVEKLRFETWFRNIQMIAIEERLEE